jgi:hypothetical protein
MVLQQIWLMLSGGTEGSYCQPSDNLESGRQLVGMAAIRGISPT